MHSAQDTECWLHMCFGKWLSAGWYDLYIVHLSCPTSPRFWWHSSCSSLRWDPLKEDQLLSLGSSFWLMAPAHHNAICWNLHTNDPSRLSIHPSSTPHTPWRPIHTHTHAHTFIHSISLPNHCHYKSQQLLLHALIINHNCFFIFPYLFNVAVRDSRGRKGGGGETEEEKPKESLLRRRKMRLEQSWRRNGLQSPLAYWVLWPLKEQQPDMSALAQECKLLFPLQTFSLLKLTLLTLKEPNSDWC